MIFTRTQGVPGGQPADLRRSSGGLALLVRATLKEARMRPWYEDPSASATAPSPAGSVRPRHNFSSRATFPGRAVWRVIKLRRAILHTLYMRRAGTYTAGIINRRSGTDHTDGEVRTELSFLKCKDRTLETPDDPGIRSMGNRRSRGWFGLTPT